MFMPWANHRALLSGGIMGVMDIPTLIQDCPWEGPPSTQLPTKTFVEKTHQTAKGSANAANQYSDRFC